MKINFGRRVFFGIPIGSIIKSILPSLKSTIHSSRDIIRWIPPENIHLTLAFLGNIAERDVANIIQAQLLFLESSDAEREIRIYLNTPGGSVYAGLGIYDTMQYINPEVSTICTGMAASMGAVLLTAGKKGKRTALKHSRVMIHQPLGGFQGQASDIEIHAKNTLKIKESF